MYASCLKGVGTRQKINYLHGRRFRIACWATYKITRAISTWVSDTFNNRLRCVKNTASAAAHDSQLLLGQSYLYLNNFPEALKSIQAALSGYEKLGKTIHICRALNNLGILYMKRNKYDEVLRIYFKALAILKTLPANQESALLANTINGNVAHVYSEQHKPRRPLEILARSCRPQIQSAQFGRVALPGHWYELSRIGRKSEGIRGADQSIGSF
jgi:tetratricopeptide (TPR) repeat protein